MPTFPPMPNIVKRDLEVLMDAMAYLLQTDSRTSGIQWILGEVGMGAPTQVPFGYVSPVTEAVTWYTSDGGSGGLAAGGPRGLDDWAGPIVLTVAHDPHRFIKPIAGAPSGDSPFAPSNLGAQVPYMEQPGYRLSLRATQNIKKVLRTNVTVGGAATDTRVVESRYVLLSINNELFRCTRLTVQAQQRRTRGD